VRVLVLLLLFVGIARAEPASPIRVSLFCEGFARTKSCSAFLPAIIEGNTLLLSAPRANTDVLLYVTANEVALVDRVHLRFVSSMPGTPPVIELDVDIDTRADDDTQRTQLEPAFLRGIALYIAARHPTAVTVALAAPEAAKVKTPKTTPYGFSMDLGGNGNYTENFQSYSAYASAEVSRVTMRDKASVGIYANGGINRQPPLRDEMGQEFSLDSSRWQVGTSGGAVWLWNRCWSIGGIYNVFRDDAKGQFRYHAEYKGGLGWDLFKPDDARGNRLAIVYFAGHTIERYNVRNEIRESFAQYPTHEVIASGSIRKDKVTLGLSLLARAEVIHPERRHTLSASPSVEVQIGDHVDFSFGFSIAKRELPGPDLDAIDPSDFEQLSRLSYADPLQVNGYFNVRIHWDRTNGARNDRFDNL
jgi:hypothetical protein